MIELETQRLYLRPFRVEDAQLMYDLNSDPEVVQYTGDEEFKNIEEVENFIKAYDQYEKFNTGRFQLFLKETGAYIGFCGLKTHTDKSVDLGFRLAKKYWGLGLAQEAAIKCIDYGFSELGLKEIVANIMPVNKKSEALILKLGFKLDSVKVEDGVKWNIFRLQALEYSPQ